MNFWQARYTSCRGGVTNGGINCHKSIMIRGTRMPDVKHSALEDRLLVRELVENWVLYRDAGDWERFRSVWHSDGRMMATWCQADAEGFITASQQGWAKGVSILHFLGGST